MDGDAGLSWEEVTACIVSWSTIFKIGFRNYQTLISISFQERFGAFFQDLDFPTEEDFNLFDVNKDGTLVYEEWKQSMSE